MNEIIVKKMDSKSSKKSQRFHELDILRFLAALAVVFFHYIFLNSTEFKELATYPVLGEFFKYGYLGVELLFIISGFVILLSASKKGWLGFIISRIARLYPAFWLALILTTLGIILFATDIMQVTPSQFLLNLTMMGNMIGTENIDPVYWTLQVEIKFYFWILMILLLKQIKHIENFIAVWLIFSVLEIFHFIHGLTHLLIMPEWAPYFSAGALFYLIQTKGLNPLRAVLLFIAYLLSIYFAVQGGLEKTQLHGLEFSPYVIAGLICLFYFVFTLIVSGKTSRIHYSWFGILGAMTYPLYLLHQTLGQIAFLAMGDSVNKYLQLFVVTIGMVVLAYLLHRYFEASFGKWLKTKLEAILRISDKKMVSTPP